MAYSYSGNDDFRGWVASNVAFSKNPTGLLSIIGNDGKINWDKANRGVDLPTLSYGEGNAAKIQNYVSDLYGQYQSASKQNQYDKNMADMQKLIASMRTPTPRFINYDITSSWNKAREMATQAVSPIYQQKMTDFINRQQQELGRKQADVATGKQALDQSLARLLEDTGTARTRTGEDTATNIGDIREAQAFADRTQGLDFDAANRALTEGLGAGNMADTGLGQQQIQEQQAQRRDMSNEQVRQMDNKVEAQNTLMNRTFQDLTVKETRGKEDTTAGKQKLDLDLERYIQDQTYERDQTQKQLELEKQADIAQRSIGVQGQLVDQWLASLAGKGYTAQEIANAASIYK